MSVTYLENDDHGFHQIKMQILNLNIYDTRRSRRCTPLFLATISLYMLIFFFIRHKFKNFVDFLILKYIHGYYTIHFSNRGVKNE